jgi:hypothetical protein
MSNPKYDYDDADTYVCRLLDEWKEEALTLILMDFKEHFKTNKTVDEASIHDWAQAAWHSAI